MKIDFAKERSELLDKLEGTWAPKRSKKDKSKKEEGKVKEEEEEKDDGQRPLRTIEVPERRQ